MPATCQVFARTKSKLANPGPMTLLRGALPKVNGAWECECRGVEPAVWNTLAGRQIRVTHLIGTLRGPAPMFARSMLRLTVNGEPDGDENDVRSPPLSKASAYAAAP